MISSPGTLVLIEVDEVVCVSGPLRNNNFASHTRSALRFSLMIRKVRCRSNLDGAHLLHSCARTWPFQPEIGWYLPT